MDRRGLDFLSCCHRARVGDKACASIPLACAADDNSCPPDKSELLTYPKIIPFDLASSGAVSIIESAELACWTLQRQRQRKNVDSELISNLMANCW